MPKYSENYMQEQYKIPKYFRYKEYSRVMNPKILGVQQ